MQRNVQLSFDLLRGKYRYHFAIILVSLIIHGLILLNDGVYWDGWPIIVDFDTVVDEFVAQGNQGHATYHMAMQKLPFFVFQYKVMNFTCITLSAILIFQISMASGFASQTESLFIALLTLSYPAFQVAIEIIMGSFIFFHTIFLLGTLLLFRLDEVQNPAKYAYRGGALLFLFIGFWLNSTLTFYGGFLLLLFARSYTRSEVPLFVAILKFIRKHIDFFALPLIFWVVKGIAFPVAEGSSYNQLEIAPTLLFNFVEFFRIINGQLHEISNTFSQFPLYLLPVAVLARLIYPIFAYENDIAPSEQRASDGHWIVFGIFLLVLGIFPYAAVEKIPTIHGWQTRFMILIGFPLAIVFVASARMLFGDVRVLGCRLRYLALVVLIVIFGSALVENYIGWQARWIKDRSVIATLHSMEDVEDITIYWVDDTYVMGGEQNYFQHEWDAIFEYAWQDDTPQTGFSVQLFPLIHRIRSLEGRQAAGCQAILTIRRGQKLQNLNNELGLTLRYFAYKFSPVGNMAEYLRDLTDVSVRRFPAPQAVECVRQTAYLEQSEGEPLYLNDTRWEIQKFRTDFIAFVERNANSMPPEQSQFFSYYDMGSYPNSQIGTLDYMLNQGLITAKGNAPLACTSQPNHELLEDLGFDVDYFELYCLVGSQPEIGSLIP